MSKYCYSSDGEYFRSEEDHGIVVDNVISSFKTPQEALGAIYYRISLSDRILRYRWFY